MLSYECCVLANLDLDDRLRSSAEGFRRHGGYQSWLLESRLHCEARVVYGYLGVGTLPAVSCEGPHTACFTVACTVACYYLLCVQARCKQLLLEETLWVHSPKYKRNLLEAEP